VATIDARHWFSQTQPLRDLTRPRVHPAGAERDAHTSAQELTHCLGVARRYFPVCAQQGSVDVRNKDAVAQFGAPACSTFTG
jgi:hypothetical protein